MVSNGVYFMFIERIYSLLYEVKIIFWLVWIEEFGFILGYICFVFVFEYVWIICIVIEFYRF